MRSFFLNTVLLLSILFAADNAYAQQRPQIGCVDKSVRVQVEQMKHDFVAQGMEVYKDAMLGMKDREPYPIAIQLNANELYQFIYVGCNQASKILFELFDGTDKKLAEKKVVNKGTNNFMIYSFKPEKTDIYLVVLSQRVKGKKQFCGSFTIMKKSTTK